MKVYDERPFTGLNNIDKASNMNKKVTMLAIIIIPIIVIAFVIANYMVIEKYSKSLYVLTNDGVAIVKKTSVEENREIEAEMHIKLFYEKFLNLDPTKDAIELSLDECYQLGGDDIKRLVALYTENGFYNNLIGENIIMRGRITNIEVDINQYPYVVKTEGIQSLIRLSNRVERTFNITCVLYNLEQRTRKNPHGYWISNLKITENKDIH